MLEPQLQTRSMMEILPPCSQVEHRILRHILACVDASPFADSVLTHAATLAMATHARMTVIRILETSSLQSPIDPVKWTLHHYDVQADLRERTSRFVDLQVDTVIVDGPAAESISAWARDNDVDLTVLGRWGESNGTFTGLGGTARRVAEIVNGSVMLVPSTQAGKAPIRYRTVLIPLDGSSRSESALPIGFGIAVAHGAEMLLVHAIPSVDLIEADPLEVEAITLRDQLCLRNERAAEHYLRRFQSRLPPNLRTRVRVLASGDARHTLLRAAVEYHADLMVLSSTGQSGHPDMLVGSVADYLINHLNIPVLLVRQHEEDAFMGCRHSSEAMAARLPSRALL